MDDEFYILVADRNRHVRDFLRRELLAEGFRVQVAKDEREVLVLTEGAEPPDLLVLDLDLPYADGLGIVDRLRECNPLLPIVIHGFFTEETGSLNMRHAAALVEKSGDTGRLKAMVSEVLRRFYPHRFALARSKGNSRGGSEI
jgi:DNA-binding response OmpR family regulator